MKTVANLHTLSAKFLWKYRLLHVLNHQKLHLAAIKYVSRPLSSSPKIRKKRLCVQFLYLFFCKYFYENWKYILKEKGKILILIWPRCSGPEGSALLCLLHRRRADRHSGRRRPALHLQVFCTTLGRGLLHICEAAVCCLLRKFVNEKCNVNEFIFGT